MFFKLLKMANISVLLAQLNAQYRVHDTIR